MKAAVICLPIFLFAAPASAALSGFHDSAEQIGTITSSSEVADAVGQRPIGALSNTGTRADGAHEWTIRTQPCDLTVFLKPIPPKGPGKTAYQLDIPGKCE